MTGMPTLAGMTDWALGKDSIFFLDRGTVSATIQLVDLHTKKICHMTTITKPPQIWGGFCVSPADIMLVENFH